MRTVALWRLVRRDLRRARGALVSSGFGIAAGTAALVFFVALWLGLSAWLRERFPSEQVELEPPKGEDAGLFGLAFETEPPAVTAEALEALQQEPYVVAVYPKLRFAFPASARGELLGRKFGVGEMPGDAVDAAVVQAELGPERHFADPLDDAETACTTDEECPAPAYCELAGGQKRGLCSDPVPAVVSPYIVEIFDKTIAPAHRMPPFAKTLIGLAEGVVFDMWIGESQLGRSKHGALRRVAMRIVGISSRAIDVGITLPLEVVRRWNREFTGSAADSYSSVAVRVRSGADLGPLTARAAALELVPRDTRARDVGALVTVVGALLTLVAVVILAISASNIAYTFLVLVSERQREIALYRAIGASGRDMFGWLMALALAVGTSAGAAGLLLGRGAAALVERLATAGLDLGFARLEPLVPDFPFKPERFFAFPPWLWLGAVAFAAFFAALGAVGPARRARRVEPMAALAAG
ncbi:MAG: ABC transporter permease [Polyangiaceae bacterium]|nr:ABC transporter permease [Polyangiaceae bacterium]